ncbi:glycoside hydrolase family 3 protein [Desulfovibrio sulfodismutans]|uniref:beta-N-acetylhexosaminidase n=1 Tax=Desulfolutivibrio sulfodismutans TaxID=63561 RepID=A0A7K3NQ54_9BACT|nr:glycoside hydrolase family 3 protein [Desulfolutivibrio sulfodismutans]NDY57943.1 glycoside hydrolase family 3 protein [Desulfolutivibrio sulfodismutans]
MSKIPEKGFQRAEPFGRRRHSPNLAKACAKAALAAFFCVLAWAMPGMAGRASSVDALCAAMSLEEKVGQVFTVYFTGPVVSDDLRSLIADYHIGGVIYYSVSGNVESPAQVAALSREIQKAAAGTPKGVGLFVSVDQEGGPVARLRRGVTLFPSNMAVAATGNPDNAGIMARIMARELSALGVNVNFAPVADVNINPKNPIIGIRSFGQDPAKVAAFTAAAVRGYSREKMLCTPKHFPGHGDTAVDSHLGLPVVAHDAATFARTDLPPFQAAITAGTRAIMTAHVELPAVDPSMAPSTLSHKVLVGLLREKLGFQGLIFTDSLGMGAMANTVGTVEAAAKALAAGADVLLFGADKGHTTDQQRQAHARIVAAVRSGEIPMARLDETVRRILTEKKRLGILAARDIKAPETDPQKLAARLATAAHIREAEKIARRSMTLLRDDAHLLPLKKTGLTLVIRPRRGAPDVDEPAEAALSAWPGVRLAPVSGDPSSTETTEVLALAREARAVVLLVSGAATKPGQARLAQELFAAHPGKVVLVASGAPYDAALFPDAPCLVATYGDVPASLTALGQSLYGDNPFRGVCPVDIGLAGPFAPDSR